MNDIISVLIPTRGRPGRLRDAVQSALDTAARPQSVEVLARVDSQDPALAEYFAGSDASCRTFIVADCPTYGQGIEFLREHAAGDILLAGGDDVLFRTDGWDEKVRHAFASCPDGLMVAYANNGRDREKCEHFFTTSRWISLLGYMVRTEFRHFCVDQWVEEMAKDVHRLVFLRDVVIEHMHRKYSKAADDDTYRMVRGDTKTSEADNALYAELAGIRAGDIERLRKAVELRKATW